MLTNDSEIPTTDAWRKTMVAARKAAGHTQKTLGAALGTSQATISDIESGEQGGSSYVLAICRILNIPPPVVTGDELERRWIEAGRALRARRAQLFERQLLFVEEMVALDAPSTPDAH